MMFFIVKKKSVAETHSGFRGYSRFTYILKNWLRNGHRCMVDNKKSESDFM